ncbi:MAG: hypothetical protein K5778_08995 [Bacteroidaceae bacterium]|nr:hypothetical protein [Bacteroidaceae bacterium]
MKEIGSFIELELPTGREWYKGEVDVARLNTGRAAIWHAFRLTRASVIWIPYYQCESVREFLTFKGCTIKYYHQDYNFNPTDLSPTQDDAVLLVNYYGMMSSERMRILSTGLPHVIIDNSQAFFCQPLPNVYNIYSARKFVGVPDGAYVIGKDAQRFTEEFPQGYSSDTADFLFKRIEYGCEGKGYKARCINENRIDHEDAMRMSSLTHALLDGTDYERNIRKRKENFATACELFADMNLIDPTRFMDEDTIPMVYPLVVEDDALVDKLLAAKHFQGHWWKYITDELPVDTFEHWLSRYMIPITIDQRYGREDLKYIKSVIQA